VFDEVIQQDRVAAGEHGGNEMKKMILVCAGLTMFVAAAAWAQPVIKDNGVSNASSYTADVARGSWFVVFGTGMGPASISVYSGSLPFPTDLSGTSVSFTPAAGGAAVSARLWYTLAGQLAALLPSSTAVGAYDIRVTYNGQPSAPKRVNVVDRNFGYATQSQNGAGPAQATYGGLDLNRFSTGTLAQYSTRPAKPGDAMILWGTGIGADANSDVTGGSAGDQTAAGQVKVLVGGIEVTPLYAGRSGGSPGLDQINFTIPASVTTGCFVSVQVRAGGRLSNAGTIAVAEPGKSFCTHPTLTEAQLKKLDQGGTLVIGSVDMSKTTVKLVIPGLGLVEKKNEFVAGSFYRYGAAAVAVAGFSVSQVGTCTVVQASGANGQADNVALLDAGAQLSLTGQNAANTAIPRESDGIYKATLYDSGTLGFGATGNPTLTQGSYTIAGTGGADIAAFTGKMNFRADLVWTNIDAIADPIPRSTALTVQWTGGGTGLVTITGAAVNAVAGTSTVFICTAPASAGAFTVPVSVLQQMPVISLSEGSAATLALMAISDTSKGQGLFTAPLTVGGTTDLAFFTYTTGTTKGTGWN
jgi:uncharacterized protein (TIGR03437 family)